MTIYVGDTLTATAATVAGEPTPSRTWQWLRDGTAISGATSNVYTVQGADEGAVLSVRQTETNFLGSASATSAETATVLFSPAALFESSELGAWYDPSDLSTMWTDTAGTTQAGVGDEVARIDDKSGNGNHATQATFAARPILRQTGGGLYYLEFDGTDDHFIGNVFTINSGVHAIIGADPDNGNLNGPALGLATSPASSALLTHNSSVFSIFASVDRRDGLISSPLDPMVVSFIQDGSNLDVSVNRVSAISSAVGMAASATLTLGRSDGQTFYFNGKLFGVVFVNAASQGSEISDTETYLAAKSGVTLP